MASAWVTVMEVLVAAQSTSRTNTKLKTVFSGLGTKHWKRKGLIHLLMVHIVCVCMEQFVYPNRFCFNIFVYVNLASQASTIKHKSHFLLQNL